MGPQLTPPSQTEPSVRSVRLIGSWDNFSASYPMERDSRRDRGQWKGCYSFRGITCDDARGVGPARDGGLKMGSTYHYYVSVPASLQGGNGQWTEERG